MPVTRRRGHSNSIAKQRDLHARNVTSDLTMKPYGSRKPRRSWWCCYCLTCGFNQDGYTPNKKDRKWAKKTERAEAKKEIKQQWD